MTRGRIWEAQTRDLSIARDADQAEFSAVSYGSCNLEAGIADERIAGAMDDFETADPLEIPHWAETDIQFDNGTSAIGDEILRRQKLMGASYPFDLTDNRIVYRASETLVYEFCLAVSQSDSLTSGEFTRLPRAFERLSRDVAKCYLGKGTNGVRTGAPPDEFEDQPKKFRECIERLHAQTGEWAWDPHSELPEDPLPTYVKDRGLDFVVWKGMPDSRRGQLFILGQCACGQNWKEKYGDLDVEDLKNWIRPLSDAPPLRAFFVPHHISNIALFAEANQKAGLTFDRARIAMLADREENRAAILEAMCVPYLDLIKLVIPQITAPQ